MKRLHVSSISILFAVLCLVFTACNQGVSAENETGTVRVVIGSGAVRSVDAEGLPVFDDTNTKITVTDEYGNTLGEGTTSVTVEAGIGTKITVKAIVTTAAGEWHGLTEHTVTKGANTVAVKLSKTLKGVANVLFSITGKDSSGHNTVSLKMKNGKELVNSILIHNDEAKPRIARDSIGRVYALYDESSTHRHLKRFNAEGDAEPVFTDSAWSYIVSNCTDIAVDTKTDTLFLVARILGNWHIYYARKENNFMPSHPLSVTTVDSAISRIHAIAAYNGMVYLAVTTGGPNQVLIACTAELSETTLTLTKKGEKMLPKLRTASAFGNSLTNCAALFADESGVCCLLKEHNRTMYAVGQLVRYTYSGNALIDEIKLGLNPKANTQDSVLTFDGGSFSNPVSFIGYDEENIYIADDGFDIKYLNENWHITENKNRIATFNRKTGNLSFSGTNATWIEEPAEYKKPDTPVLLWKKDWGSITYWTSSDGTDALSAANTLFERSTSEWPTDVFCYDQDGNLYILWKYGSDHKVRRFALKEDGSYEKPGEDAFLTSHDVSAIAVDISDGQNSLYYTYADGHNGHIEKYSWPLDSPFTSGTSDAYAMFNPIIAPVTALAANKDGVFVGVTETYKDGSIDKYRLKVQKYKKADGGHDSEITLVDNAVSYTDVTTGDPIADPSPGHDPNQACNQYQETINGLQIANGMLYGISSKLHRKWLMNVSHVWSPDVFKHSSILYKIGSTTEALPNRPLAKKERPVDDTNKVGYGFYRFIAVKYDEAERIRLIIASDSAWGKDGSGHSSPDMANTDTIVEFNLKDMLFREVKRSDNVFSKTLMESGFDWN